VRRLAPAIAAALALAALAACRGESSQECPGEPVGTVRFTGTLVGADYPALAGRDPAPATPDCRIAGSVPADGEAWPSYPDQLGDFDATLSAEPGTQNVTLCRPGLVMYGVRSGSSYRLEMGTDGAVLPECASTCAASLRLVIAGEVTGGAQGEPLAFKGVLVEVMTRTEGSCGACTLPCAARYALKEPVP
jgi:hypothetical protein